MSQEDYYNNVPPEDLRSMCKIRDKTIHNLQKINDDYIEKIKVLNQKINDMEKTE